jgi:hypothetical protein
MGDQRIGRQGQQFIENEQREQVARKRNTHGAAKRHGEETVERRLAPCVVAAQIANGIDRRHHPQEARQQGKHKTQRLNLEADCQPGNWFHQINGRPGSAQYIIVQ